MIEDVRIFLTDWSLAITSIIGLLIAWNSARPTVMRWFRALNLYRRVDLVEKDVAQLKADEKELN